MVGMLQIITYLLCIYLVFKGVEILQIALSSQHQKNEIIIGIGVVAVVASLFIGYHFYGWVNEMANSVSNSTSGAGMDFNY